MDLKKERNKERETWQWTWEFAVYIIVTNKYLTNFGKDVANLFYGAIIQYQVTF
jgi:hypothetical protein